MPEAKPYGISKQLVWDAYQRVKANRGAAGVDGESLEAFEKDLKGNLFKIWNRMSSGSYFPPPVRQMTSRMRGRSLAQVCQDLRMYLPGWKAYFRLVEFPTVFRELDSWIRHSLRALRLKQWIRGVTIFRELRARGLSPRDARRVAGNAYRWWHNSGMRLIGIALTIPLVDRLGLPRLAA